MVKTVSPDEHAVHLYSVEYFNARGRGRKGTYASKLGNGIDMGELINAIKSRDEFPTRVAYRGTCLLDELSAITKQELTSQSFNEKPAMRIGGRWFRFGRLKNLQNRIEQ